METYRAFQEFHCENKLDGLDFGALSVLCEFQFQIRDRLFSTTTVRESIRRQNRCSFTYSHGFYCLFSMISYIFTFSLCCRLLHVCVLIIFFIAFMGYTSEWFCMVLNYTSESYSKACMHVCHGVTYLVHSQFISFGL